MKLLEMECCGYSEIHYLQLYNGNFLQAMRELELLSWHEENPVCGAVIFTQAGAKATYGDRFARDIVKNKLGSVTKIPAFTNPNTGNKIVSYVWRLNKKNVKAYYKRHKLWEPPYNGW